MKKKNKNLRIIVIMSIIFCLGIFCGWLFFYLNDNSNNYDTNEYLRLGGYQYINPLLVCDISEETNNKNLDGLENQIKELIEKNQTEGVIDVASVYYKDLSTGEQINVNPDEKYYPASLNKVPLMIAYLKYAESNSNLFNQKIKVENNIPDTNSLQEIKPKEEAKIGESYSVDDLLGKMIKFSDNNAFYALASGLDKKYFTSTYSDFNINYPENQEDKPDFITTYDFSYFLRVLYNATYLKRDLSEKALKIMSEVDYADGLIAGLPSDIKVSHKFGYKNDIDASGQTVARELHDCGIIYDPNGSYVLCVMTKSKKEIPEISSFIKSVSELVYKDIKE